MLFLNILIQNTIKVQYFPVGTNKSKNKPKQTPMLALKLATNFSVHSRHTLVGRKVFPSSESSSHVCINDCPLLPADTLKFKNASWFEKCLQKSLWVPFISRPISLKDKSTFKWPVFLNSKLKFLGKISISKTLKPSL